MQLPQRPVQHQDRRGGVAALHGTDQDLQDHRRERPRADRDRNSERIADMKVLCTNGLNIGPARPRARHSSARAELRSRSPGDRPAELLPGARGRRRRRSRDPQRRGDRRPRQPGQRRGRQQGRPRPLRHRRGGAQGCQEARHRLARRAQARLARGQVGVSFQDRHERHPFCDGAGAPRHRRRR